MYTLAHLLLLAPTPTCALISASLISALVKIRDFLHVNTRSVLPKMDQLKVWVHSSKSDVLVITDYVDKEEYFEY